MSTEGPRITPAGPAPGASGSPERLGDALPGPKLSSFRTSEFLALVTIAIADGIVALVSSNLNAGRVMTLITVLTAAFIVSRGLAKVGRHSDKDDGL